MHLNFGSDFPVESRCTRQRLGKLISALIGTSHRAIPTEGHLLDRLMLAGKSSLAETDILILERDRVNFVAGILCTTDLLCCECIGIAVCTQACGNYTIFMELYD